MSPMRRTPLLLLLFLNTAAVAKLIPTYYLASPRILKLTRAEALSHWQTDFFGQCHGISAVPVPRFAEGESVPFVFVASDAGRSLLTFGTSFEKQGQRGYIWGDQVGGEGVAGSKISCPYGVAIDTLRYGGDSTMFSVYVANGLEGSVSRWHLDYDGHALSYVDDIYYSQGALLCDVDCRAGGNGECVVAVLDNAACRVVVLKVDSLGGQARVVAQLGSPGPGAGQFSDPAGVSLADATLGSDSLWVFVADAGNQRVVRLLLALSDSSLTWDRFYTIPDGSLSDITATAFGTLYVTDIEGNRIYALPTDLAGYTRAYGDLGLVRPTEITTCGDELVVCEAWTDSSGIQYFRVVPEIEELSGGCRFDATRDSGTISFGISETRAHCSIEIPRSQTQIVSDTVLPAGHWCAFPWMGRGGDGRLVRPDPGNPYTVRVAVQYRPAETETCFVDIGYVADTVAGTSVFGSVSGEWTPGMNPIVLTGDVTVEAGSTLTVDAGTMVMPDSGCKITVRGVLKARGSPLHPIHVTPYRRLLPVADTCTPGAWQGIRIENEAGALCSLDHCIIEYAGNPNGDYHDSAAIVCEKEGGLSLTNSGSSRFCVGDLGSFA